MVEFWLNYTTRLTQLTTSKKKEAHICKSARRVHIKRSGSKSRLVLKSSKETLLHYLWRYQKFKVLLYKQLVVGMWASTPSCWYPSADVWIEHIKTHLISFQGVLWIHWTVELIISRCWGNSRGLSKHSQTSYSQFMSLHFIFVLFLELDLQHVSNKRTKWHTEIEEQKLLVF